MKIGNLTTVGSAIDMERSRPGSTRTMSRKDLNLLVLSDDPCWLRNRLRKSQRLRGFASHYAIDYENKVMFVSYTLCLIFQVEQKWFNDERRDQAGYVMEVRIAKHDDCGPVHKRFVRLLESKKNKKRRS